jgi:hypothetical protein
MKLKKDYKATTLFMSESSTLDEILDAAEYCINILESCELVSMYN